MKSDLIGIMAKAEEKFPNVFFNPDIREYNDYYLLGIEIATKHFVYNGTCYVHQSQKRFESDMYIFRTTIKSHKKIEIGANKAFRDISDYLFGLYYHLKPTNKLEAFYDEHY